jgi:hypothetical protein
VIGLAVFVRYTNILPVGIFLAIEGVRLARAHGDMKDMLAKLWPIIPGGLPWAAALLMLNSFVYGHPLRSGYYFSGEEGVYILSQVPLFMFRFLGIMLLLYPGMLWGALRGRLSVKWSILSAALVTFAFYAGFPSTFFEGRVLDLIFGARFLVPVLPWILLLFVKWLDGYSDRKWFQPLVLFSTIGLVILSIGISVVHYQFLQATSFSL